MSFLYVFVRDLATKSFFQQGLKIMRFYRKEFKEEPTETLSMIWNPKEDNRTLYLTSNYRQLNDYIKMEIEVPLDLWDYDYADENTKYVYSII